MAEHRKYLPLNAARELVGTSHLLGALKDGTLSARGRYNTDVETQDPSSDFEPIKAGHWHDGRVSFESGSLSIEIRAVEEGDPSVRAGYVCIEVLAEDLGSIPGSRPKENPGGRPRKYDWDLLLQEINRRVDFGVGLHFPSKEAFYSDLRRWYKDKTGVDIPTTAQVRRVVRDLVDEFGLPYPVLGQN
ncbi:MAG: hypothetical protein KIT43_14620 [Bauldia sp.]|nr:hypothetical protein [Bauldia sp.]